jgi:AAHS family 4-hydroxybenzoate transporter-like MFS transporter
VLEYRSVRQNPWWIPPFLGGVPATLSPEHLRLLGVLTFVLFCENYDIGVLGNALPQLAASFGLGKAEVGDFTGRVILGALPAFLVVPLADRIGRRRLLLFSVVCMSVGSMLTATSQSATQFVLFQFWTRTFLISAAVLSVVIVTEEFPAEHRGWGIGMLSGVAAIGFGVGALLYGFVNRLPLGWRALYLAGIVPLLVFPWLRRGVSETRRFNRARGAALAVEGVGSALTGAFHPITALVRQYPRRALAISLIGGLSSLGINVSFLLISEFLQTMRGWTPGAFAGMSIVFGAFGIIGNPAAGRLADRYGRRSVILAALLVFPLFTAAFYAGPPSIVALPWTVMVFLNMASSVMQRALMTELFPTASRGAAGGLLSMVTALGTVAGSFLYARAMEWLGNDQSLVIPLLSLATVVAAAGVFLVPETARRELEQISDEGAST